MAGGPSRLPTPAKKTNGHRREFAFRPGTTPASLDSILHQQLLPSPPTFAAKILVNGQALDQGIADDILPPPAIDAEEAVGPESDENTFKGPGLQQDERGSTRASYIVTEHMQMPEPLEQSANFFDPENRQAARIREQVAQETLDELLDYILEQGGSVGIFDATNSTLKRRKMIMKHIRERAGPELGVLFLESLCVDENVGSSCV